MEVNMILLGIATVLFFGYFSELIFRRYNVPDLLLLILFGFIIGPSVLGWVHPSDIVGIAPPFTTFVLLFLLFDGAFNIDLNSFAKGLSKGFQITFFNFLISSILITLIMRIIGYPWLIDFFTGFALGGVSSAFVVPIIKELNIKLPSISVLTLESAFTDVLSIVFSVAVLDLISLATFSVKNVFSSIATLFAVGGLLGIIAGGIWIFINLKFFRGRKFYMITIAYVILLYVLTEFLGGNGAIATLFFGLVLGNSKQLTAIVANIESDGKSSTTGTKVMSSDEQFFYEQVSFLLKTFFFVYIGVLINFSDMKALIIGTIISVVVMFARNLAVFLTKNYSPTDKRLVTSMFARGLAAAVLAQVAIQKGIQFAPLIANVAYIVITFTIVLSSVRIFLFKNSISGLVDAPKAPVQATSAAQTQAAKSSPKKK